MGRRRLTEEDFEFARQFGNKLAEAIEAQDLTRDEAAERVGVHRSMLFRYLGGRSIPGAKVLQRACEELGVAVDYRGIRVDAEFYKDETKVERPQSVSAQTEFAFVRESLVSERARVDIRKRKQTRGETLEVTMRIQLGATNPRRRER